ncbi:MAG TPA: HDOD domain-containing protein [Anaeromyxobacter sp.]|nr:HDOD domain-containing protein [Anaeromyxobacter sp.]
MVSKHKVKVPPYPAVAFRIEAVVRGGNYGLDELAKLVSSDQVLAADVLRCANSALYARGSPVASVKQAVGRIGARDVARLALASGLGAHALAKGRLSSVRRRIWLDALASALLCQDLARVRRLPPDVAFAAGLLHDFGKVVTIACIEELLQNRNDVAPKTEAEWNDIMDRYHLELGVVMAARWDLPPVIADAISLHHSAEVTAASEPLIVNTVMVVDRVVALLAEHTRLGAEELKQLEDLGPHEREVVIRTVEMLPGFIASFENSDVWRGDAQGGLVAPGTPPPERAGPKPPSYPVVLKLGDREHSYQLLGIGATHCMVTGKSAIPENLLMELKVGCEPPLRGYASVKLAWPDQEGWTLLVQPYGLTEGAQARWKQLTAQADAAAG